MLEKIFHLKAHNTTVRKELVAGITTFMTMAYILVVNPAILSTTGMDQGALFTATALTAILGTVMMALMANLPIALAPGMGLNAFFAYTVVLKMGYSWQFALAGVFIEGLIFILLTLFNIREAIVNSIPKVIKKSIAIGIGLFITIIGLSSSKVIINGPTIVALGDLKDPSVVLTLLSILIIGVLLIRNVKGALLVGIGISTILGLLMGVTPLDSLQGFTLLSLPPSIAPIFGQIDFSSIFSMDMLVVVVTFMFVDIFDTAGTLIGVCQKGGMIDSEGNIPKAKQAFLADAIATTLGAVFGTSTVTSFIESAAGVAQGGRTGLTAMSTAVLFALALFMAPLFSIVPVAATSAVLVIVGLFMITSISEIDFHQYQKAIPAFLCIVMMPLSYSIADGIMAGVVCYSFIHLLSGQGKKVSIGTYIITALFLAKVIFL